MVDVHEQPARAKRPSRPLGPSYSSCLDDCGVVTDLSNYSEAQLSPASVHRPMESIVLLSKQLVATVEHLSAMQTQQDS